MSSESDYNSEGSDDTAELLATLRKGKKKPARKSISKAQSDDDDDSSVEILEDEEDDDDSSFDSEPKPKKKPAEKKVVSKKRPLSATKTAPTKKVKITPLKTAAKPKAAASAKPKTPKALAPIVDDFDIVLPYSTPDVSILVQIDPDDAANLEVAAGAIGRLETDSAGVTLDLQGCQYRGRLYPGPTALVLTAKPKTNTLRVDAVVDEFCRLVQGSDHMATMEGTVVQGDYSGSYFTQEENVNRKSESTQDAADKKTKRKGKR